ncbi:unnamed protein product [Umbelopsis ramanniana]
METTTEGKKKATSTPINYFLSMRYDTHSISLTSNSSLINYLASLYRDRQLAVPTLAAYRSTILDLFDDRTSASTSPQLKAFFTALQKKDCPTGYHSTSGHQSCSGIPAYTRL